ncbi:MAG: ABC transporter permease [Flavobacteriales bacterium]|jgi:heme exporter protein B|nr:ABC transporter permease [Flavobacteriales bacterium]
MNNIIFLIKKEAQLEFRQKYALGGILLYVISTTFVCYLSFRSIVDIPTWNALYWIIVLFASVNAIAKSFTQESVGKLLYLYTLTNPRAIVISKIIYNSGLLIVLTLATTLFYSLFLGNVIGDLAQFIIVAIAGSMGLASVLTLVSAIAAKTNNNVSLMAILSFPIILPLLITIIHASKNAIDDLGWSVNGKYIIVLLALNALITTLSYLLFPYLWRD